MWISKKRINKLEENVKELNQQVGWITLMSSLNEAKVENLVEKVKMLKDCNDVNTLNIEAMGKDLDTLKKEQINTKSKTTKINTKKETKVKGK